MSDEAVVGALSKEIYFFGIPPCSFPDGTPWQKSKVFLFKSIEGETICAVMPFN